jgi:hypothetical protein
MINVKAALAERQGCVNSLRCGLLVRLASLWIGAHYSTFDRRWCINLLPCVTLWITLPGGHLPR